MLLLREFVSANAADAVSRAACVIYIGYCCRCWCYGMSADAVSALAAFLAANDVAV